MNRARAHLLFASIAVAMAAVGASGCLPSDTRPPPAEIQFVTGSGDDPAGVVTSDGWTLSVSHLIVGIGGASFSHACTLYSDSSYMRLLDGTRQGDQKICTMYALGRCEFDFRVGWPDGNTVLGEGITEDDLLRLGSMTMGPVDPAIHAGIGVELAMTATKEGRTKRLAWAFRQATTYIGCHLLDGTKRVGVNLESDAKLVLRVSLAATQITASDNRDDAPLLFEPFAAADDMFRGNQDGEVTLDEIGDVPLSDARTYGTYGITTPLPDKPSLRAYVFLQTLANVARLGDGMICNPQLGIREGRPN